MRKHIHLVLWAWLLALAVGFNAAEAVKPLGYGATAKSFTPADDGSGLTGIPAGTALTGVVPLAAIPAHASTHLLGGSDALTTAAPSDTGTANSAGSSSSLARADHVHRDVLLQTAASNATTDVTYTSSTMTDVTGASVTITTSAGSVVKVDAYVAGLNLAAATNTLSVSLVIDGVADYGCAQSTVIAGAASCSIHRTITGLSAASHTCKLQVAVSSVLGFSVNASSMSDRQGAAINLLESRL